MDIKDYIASGVVEMYTLGALQDAERTEFEQRILMYPELANELKQVQIAIASYAKSYAINPNPELRSKILTETIHPGGKSSENSNGKYSEKNHTLTYKYLIAASLAALAISTFASWFFYSRWEDSEERFSQLLTEKNQLAQNYNLVKDGFDKTVYDILIMRDENSYVINLHSADTSLNYKARLYWNRHSHEIYIDVLKLPEPELDYQYQLWAKSDTNIISGGLFDAHEFSGMQRMLEINQADSFLVTMEPKGGIKFPTLDNLVLISSNWEGEK